MDTEKLEAWLFKQVREGEEMQDAGGSAYDRHAYAERSKVCAEVLRRLKSPRAAAANRLRTLGSDWRFKMAHGFADASEAQERYRRALEEK